MPQASLWLRKGRACVLCALGVLASTLATAEQLVVFGPQDAPPNLERRDGRLQGFLFDILKAAEPFTGDTYAVQAGPWARMAAQAAAGEGGIVAFSKNAERERLYDYSVPLCFEDLGLVVAKGREFPYRNLEDLRGKRVSAAIGTSHGREVDDAVARGLFKLDRDAAVMSRLRKVLEGLSDAAIVGNGQYGFATTVAESNLSSEDKARLVLLPTPLARDPLHLGFLKSMNKGAALERLNAALPKVQKLGWMCNVEKTPSYTAKK
jgi:polar amino acid transport system substrate-binding protein